MASLQQISERHLATKQYPLLNENIFWNKITDPKYHLQTIHDGIEYKIQAHGWPSKIAYSVYQCTNESQKGDIKLFDLETSEWPLGRRNTERTGWRSASQIFLYEEEPENLDPDNRRAEFFNQDIQWRGTWNAEYPFRTYINGQTYRIRVNDWPDNPMFSFIENNKVIFDFDDWPNNWFMPQMISYCTLL